MPSTRMSGQSMPGGGAGRTGQGGGGAARARGGERGICSRQVQAGASTASKENQAEPYRPARTAAPRRRSASAARAADTRPAAPAAQRPGLRAWFGDGGGLTRFLCVGCDLLIVLATATRATPQLAFQRAGACGLATPSGACLHGCPTPRHPPQPQPWPTAAARRFSPFWQYCCVEKRFAVQAAPLPARRCC